MKPQTISAVLFILVLLIAGMLPWLLMKLVYGSRGFSELYPTFSKFGDGGILCSISTF